jgi:glycosyltransferase involved in cell wall biosynthesis
MQKNILMVLETTFPPDERVENEILVLTKEGFHVTLVCAARERKGKITIEENNSLTIYRIPISRFIYKSGALALLLPFYFSFWVKQINQIIKKVKINAIHIHDLPLVKVGLQLSKKHKIPLVADYHENRPEIMKLYSHVQTFPGRYLISINGWFKYQMKQTPKVDRLILVTDEAKEYYVKYYNIEADKITVLPNYISLERFRLFNFENEASPDKKKYFTVVYFGETGLRRGTMTILESAKQLKDENIRFLIIGNSREQQYLEKITEDWNLSNVKLTGRLPVSEAMKLIAASDVGLCPFLRNIHHDTTYANKMFQYMALGKPVIVSDCTSQVNVVVRESCGLVFKAGDASELSKSILKLRHQPEYIVMSKNAKACINNKYNWETTGIRLIELYNGLLNLNN